MRFFIYNKILKKNLCVHTPLLPYYSSIASIAPYARSINVDEGRGFGVSGRRNSLCHEVGATANAHTPTNIFVTYIVYLYCIHICT